MYETIYKEITHITRVINARVSNENVAKQKNTWDNPRIIKDSSMMIINIKKTQKIRHCFHKFLH